MSSFQPTFRMLSIDGGGIRGIIPAMVLTEIEKRTNKRIYELFDLIAGTSTGGILASGLTMPADNQQGAKYTAADMVNIYDNCGSEIFSKSGWRKWLGKMDELFGSRFDATSLESLLLRYFGEARLTGALTEIVVNTYCMQRRLPINFNSRIAKTQPQDDFLLRDVCRATSAGPTYFPPKELPSDTDVPFVFIDGGVYANHPGIIAYTEAKKLRNYHKTAPKKGAKIEGMLGETVQAADIEEPFFMLSLGTGNFIPPFAFDKAKEWGVIGWIQPTIDILMQGVSESTHEQLQFLLPPALDGTDRYVRINVHTDASHCEMSDASRSNIDALKAFAVQMIKDNDKVIDKTCALLTQ
jgi:uncharacterized protein